MLSRFFTTFAKNAPALENALDMLSRLPYVVLSLVAWYYAFVFLEEDIVISSAPANPIRYTIQFILLYMLHSNFQHALI